MNDLKRHKGLFWLTWIALTISVAVAGDVVEDLLIEGAEVPVSSGTLPDPQIENSAEDLLIPSVRFVSLSDCHQCTLLPIEGMHDSSMSTALAQLFKARRFLAKELQDFSSPTGFLPPLRI